MRSEDSKVILVRPIGMEAHTFTFDPVALAQRIGESPFKELNVPHTYTIHIYFTRYAVFPFNAPLRRCYRCQRLGHVAVNCNSPLRCLVCSGPHTKDECTAEPGQEKCANYHQTHIASSKECPAIRNAAAIQKLQRSGVGFEAAKHKVMKTQAELVTKAQLMKKQNLTIPIVSLNIMGSQLSVQGNQQENQNDLIVQEVMVDIHQSGGSYLWSDAEVLPSTAHSTAL
ncbi:Zinc finger CCHC-type [Trinorchestia longiramus]|nr:Zinc finger CCHC-type [Trinorchestia longiramus]